MQKKERNLAVAPHSPVVLSGSDAELCAAFLAHVALAPLRLFAQEVQQAV